MARKKKEVALTPAGLPADYAPFLEALKNRVGQAQTRAMLSVNRELIQLYWDMGRLIVERQEQAGWGRSVVERLADDIQKAFPGMGGFSRTNVFQMRAFFLAYQNQPEIVPQAVGQKKSGKKVAQPVRQLKAIQKVAQPVPQLAESGPPKEVAGLPWGHDVVLLQKVKNRAQRLRYAAKADYALRDISKPIGVAEWQTHLVKSLPESLKGSLPSIKDIEAEFGSMNPS